MDEHVLAVIAEVFHTTADCVTDIEIIKNGMTNKSFVFQVCGGKYIMRIPGEGTVKLISRGQEAEVYQKIAGKGLCDDVVYINPEQGFKITKFLDHVRVCNPFDMDDVAQCVSKLKYLHEMNLSVSHRFDLFGQIQFYEQLREGEPSRYQDYEETKQHIWQLKPYIDQHAAKSCLCHIDAVPDNFLFCQDGSGAKQLQLIDWEYAAMQDPHVDLAMFSIYSFYNRQQIDRLADLYFEGECPPEIRLKIYCYIAVCGLLWSNWCEYKRKCGVTFGQYALCQYRYAQRYYEIAAGIFARGEE